jgi:hypothetical protein
VLSQRQADSRASLWKMGFGGDVRQSQTVLHFGFVKNNQRTILLKPDGVFGFHYILSGEVNDEKNKATNSNDNGSGHDVCIDRRGPG